MLAIRRLNPRCRTIALTRGTVAAFASSSALGAGRRESARVLAGGRLIDPRALMSSARPRVQLEPGYRCFAAGDADKSRVITILGLLTVPRDPRNVVLVRSPRIPVVNSPVPGD